MEKFTNDEKVGIMKALDALGLEVKGLNSEGYNGMPGGTAQEVLTIRVIKKEVTA